MLYVCVCVSIFKRGIDQLIFQSYILLSAESCQILTNLGLRPAKYRVVEFTFTLQNEKALLGSFFRINYVCKLIFFL